MTRTHARSLEGARVVDAVPKNWGDNVTVAAALTLDGIVAPMMLQGAMTARAFEAYVEQNLAPELRPGDVVVLDKLNAHKTERVRELVEATGARLMYLPGYSPDFNPIEHAVEVEVAAPNGRCTDRAQAVPRPAMGTAADHQRRCSWLDLTLRLPRSMSLTTAVAPDTADHSGEPSDGCQDQARQGSHPSP